MTTWGFIDAMDDTGPMRWTTDDAGALTVRSGRRSRWMRGVFVIATIAGVFLVP